MGNMFWNNGTGDSRSMPHMADRGQPVSALNQLLQQYFFQSRLGTAADPFIPFNLFSAPSMNSFPSNFDNPLDCLNSLIQQNSAANPIIVQIPASNQRFQQLMSQRPLKSLPESVPDSPHISDRQSEICKCVCETPGSSTEHSNDSYTQTWKRIMDSYCQFHRVLWNMQTIHQGTIYYDRPKNILTISQTTNFRLFQSERGCRRQFWIW